MKARLSILLLVAVSLMGFVLRVWGICFGLPYVYHIDETSYTITAILLGHGQLSTPPYDPTGFSNLIFIEYGGFYVIARMFGVLRSGRDLGILLQNDPTVFFLLSRLTSAVLGTATIIVVYVLGKRIRSKAMGIVAAVLLATDFLHVRDSHYGTPDVAMTCFVTLCITFCVIALEDLRIRNLLFSGITGGFAVAMKWIALPVCLPVLAIGLTAENSKDGLTTNWSRSKIFGASFIGLVLGAALGSIQIVLNPIPYWGKVYAEYITARAQGFNGFWVDTLPGWLFYLKTLEYGVGIIMLVLALIGLLARFSAALKDRNRISFVLLLFPLVYYALMGSTTHYFARYVLPLVPFIALFAADAVMMVGNWGRSRGSSLGMAMMIVLVLAAVVQPLPSSIQHDELLTLTDTRTLAKQWIESHLPAGSKIAVDWPVYGPPLSTSQVRVPNSNRIYDVTIVGGTGLSDHSVEWFRQQRYDYLIASSFIYDIHLVDEKQDAERESFYASLDRDLTLVAEFKPNQGESEPSFIFDEIYGPAVSLWERERPGPTLKIYQVR